LGGEGARPVSECLASVRAAVAGAAREVNRDPTAIRIIAVTKGFPAERAAEAVRAGLADLGENYVQEARRKRSAVAPPARWHLIGGLQRNKVRAAVGLFDVVQTVDGEPLAELLASEAARAGRRLAVLLQVNTTGEGARRGLSPEGVEPVARTVLGLRALVLEGLMTIALPGGDARACFRTLAEVRKHVETCLGVELPHLSMGMSDDFRVAVEEGATLLRLGRALFGARGAAAGRPGSSAGGEGS